MDEHLTKATHDLGFARDSLKEALHAAGPVEAIILIPLLSRLAGINADIEQLLSARKESHGTPTT